MAGSFAAMLELMRAFIDIALWRKGPQHLPRSGLLFVITTTLYFLVTIVLVIAVRQLTAEASQLSSDSVLASAAIDVAITLAWIACLFFIVRGSSGFYQMAIAVFGVGIVLQPLILEIPVTLARLGAGTIAGLLFPLMIAWYWVVIVHIVRNALGIRLYTAALLTGGYILCQYLAG